MRTGAGTFFLVASLLSLVLTGCGNSVSGEALPAITPWEAEAVKMPDVPVTSAEPDKDGVEFKGVSLATDMGFITVDFMAPVKVADAWQEGSIYVIDEKTGIAYKDIPRAPLMGPLFGKPKTEGQLGYVMLINQKAGLAKGSAVSVIIGNYKRVHAVIQ
jgi:hypothetical protein